MRVLFINPYIYDFTAFDLWLRPLGLLYLASVVKKYSDCEIHWIDVLDRFQNLNTRDLKPENQEISLAMIQNRDGRGKFHREIVDKPEFYQQVPRHYSRYGIPVSVFKDKLDQLPEIDLVFMTSLMTYWIDGIRFTIDCIKYRFPHSTIILGGVLPTLMPGQIKQIIPVDDIIIGPGEQQILGYLQTKQVKIHKHPDFSNVNAIPFPAFEHLSSQKILPLLTSRGCPYHCSYCATGLLNHTFLERSPENIVREISEFSDLYNPEHFIIFDDALLINQKKLFFKAFSTIRSVTSASFHTPNGLHAREIKEYTAQLLFDSGFKTLRLSFESTKPEILAKSSHKITVREMIQAVKHLEMAGYQRKEIEVYLLFGIQNQTRKDMEDTLSFIGNLGIIPRLSFFSPVPGTPDFLKLQKDGVLSKDINIYETNKTYFVYQKSGFSHHDIRYLKELTNQIVQLNRGIL